MKFNRGRRSDWCKKGVIGEQEDGEPRLPSLEQGLVIISTLAYFLCPAHGTTICISTPTTGYLYLHITF